LHTFFLLHDSMTECAYTLSLQQYNKKNLDEAATHIMCHLSLSASHSGDIKDAQLLADAIVKALCSKRNCRLALDVAKCNLAVSTRINDSARIFINTVQVSRILRKIGLPLQSAISYERAEKLARKSSDRGGSNLKDLADTVLGKGLALSQCGKAHQTAAERAFLVAIDMYAHMKNKKGEAIGVYNLALHYTQRKINSTKAENLARRACTLVENKGTTSVEACYLRASIASSSGKHGAAMKLVSKARVLALRYYGPKHVRTATIARRLTY